jgi:restriction endonuclease Mrr
MEIKDSLRQSQSRAAPGSILPEHEYWKPMLEFIVEAGGSAPAGEVIGALGERLRGSLTSRDQERLETGEVRWRNRVRFARLRMTQQGLLSDASPRGVWQVTDAGRSYLDSDDPGVS